MARAPCTFRQSDAERLMKAAVKAGMTVQRVEVTRDGKITVIADEPSNNPAGPNGGGATAPADWSDAK
jgi:hypothetical protein